MKLIDYIIADFAYTVKSQYAKYTEILSSFSVIVNTDALSKTIQSRHCITDLLRRQYYTRKAKLSFYERQYINMAQNTYSRRVEICGVNTSKLANLSSDEKKDLLVRAKNGDTAARDELISGNLRLVLSVIRRFQSRGENIDDLFQVGCIGLIKAVDNFDLSLDLKFSTYAVLMIIGEIRRHLRDYNSIRVSRSVRDLAYRALQAREQLTKTLDREPTVEDIAKVLECKCEEVSAALEAIVEPVSLYEPVFSDGGDSIYIMDQISDSESTDEAWLEDIALREAMKKLSPREKSIIELRYFGGRTQMEIAGEIGISQAQVSRIEKGALERMKKEM